MRRFAQWSRRCAARSLLALGLVVAPIGASGQQPAPPPAVSFERSSLVVDTASGPLTFDVELALTPEQQQRGLMFRPKLGPQEGMLFDFRIEQPLSFWMANTLIPLDMIFIAADGTIRRIHANAEPLSTKNIDSGSPVRAVLEINGGAARLLGIKPGDKVRHAVFGTAK